VAAPNWIGGPYDMTSTGEAIYNVYVEGGRATATCTVLINDLGSQYRMAEIFLHRSDFPKVRLSRYQHFQRLAEPDNGFIERRMREAFGAGARVEITRVGRATQTHDVEAKMEAAKDYLTASGFTDLQESTSGEAQVRTIRMKNLGAERALRLGLWWLRDITPAELYALLARKDVALMLRDGEGGIDIRDSSTIHHYRIEGPA
jgi:hypothetical protein